MSGFKGNRIFIYGVLAAVFFVCFIRFYATFSLSDGSFKFESLVYDIDDNYINNISVSTSVELFLKYFDIENCSIRVVDINDRELETGYIYSGSKTILYNSSNQIIKTYINVVKGDIVNDGVVLENDLKKIGECLVGSCDLDDYAVKVIDVDNDGDMHLNDLLLLDKAVTFGYTDISIDKENMVLQTNEKGRFVVSLEPSYGVNQNLNWVSLDEKIATIDDSGMVIGHNEGETKIQATTLDGKFMVESSVKIDNTIQLASNEGIGYVGGADLKVKIKLVDYEGVSCKVLDEEVAECSIDGEYLVVKTLGQGVTNIVVSTSNYGNATYKLQGYSVYLNVMPKYFCVTPGNVSYITVSSFHSGTLSFSSSDKEIISNAYMDTFNGRKMLRMEFGNKQGRGVLTVKESNGNQTNQVVVDVTRVLMAEIGRFTKVGEEISTLIVGDNLGNLSCSSDDDNKATCRIEGNHLIVTPLSIGEVYVRVYNKFLYNDSLYNCGEALFLVVIQE